MVSALSLRSAGFGPGIAAEKRPTDGGAAPRINQKTALRVGESDGTGKWHRGEDKFRVSARRKPGRFERLVPLKKKVGQPSKS